MTDREPNDDARPTPGGRREGRGGQWRTGSEGLGAGRALRRGGILPSVTHASSAPERAAPSAAETSIGGGRKGHDAATASRWADRVAGLAVGTQILIKAADKLPHFSRHPFLVGFLFLAGAFVTVGSVAHERLERRVRNAHGLFHLVEGAVLVLTAVLLLENGRLRLPLVLLLVGCLYAVSGAISYVLTPENRERVGRRFLRSVGVVLLLAGAALGGFTAVGDRDPWAFGIGGLLLVIGISMTLFSDRLLRRFDHPGHV